VGALTKRSAAGSSVHLLERITVLDVKIIFSVGNRNLLGPAVSLLLIVKQQCLTHNQFCMSYLMRPRSTDFWNIVSPIKVSLPPPPPYFFLRIPFPHWSSLVTLQSAVCGLRMEKDKDGIRLQVLVNTQHFSGPISSVYMTSLSRDLWIGSWAKFTHLLQFRTDFITKFTIDINILGRRWRQ
jgi:hypothetical protein